MKDWYMVFVLLVVVATPFLPLFLKSPCPACKKRKLETLETLSISSEETSPRQYFSFHHCHACAKYFKREKSGPFTETDASEYEQLKRANTQES
ncbi:MAG: hypothetical protein K2W82_02780 [Candidatus Obscuribacterales bacterium]|jgi:hypothetical protein|nr:hypothetical protein [Candidatus Obscuribacterales bacterium]